MIKVSNKDVTKARERWYDYWGRGHRWKPFWSWIGLRNRYDLSAFYFSEESARKIKLLNSNHYLTVLKMIEAKNE